MFKVKREIVENFIENYNMQRYYLAKMLLADSSEESNKYLHDAKEEEKKMDAIVFEHLKRIDNDFSGVSIACDLVKAIGNRGIEKVIGCLNVCEVELV